MTTSNEFQFPTTGLRVKNRATLLAIDDVSLPLRKALCYTMTKPEVRQEPVLEARREDPNAPDNLATHFYGTVLHDQGKFRMWYYAVHLGENPDWPEAMRVQRKKVDASDLWQGPICYAESEDGIHWERPNLGQVKFKGSTDNNCIKLPHLQICEAHVIRDDDDPDPARRYKLAYWVQDEENIRAYPSLCCAVSPDGLHWTVSNNDPTDMFFEGGSFYKHNGYYIVNGQAFCSFTRSEGDTDTGRHGIAMLSNDFDNWIQEWGVSFVLPEPVDHDKRGPGKPYDQVHLGTGAVSYGNVAVGLYALWHDKPEFPDISADFGLVVSNDGIAFREPEKGYIYLAAEDSMPRQHPTKPMNTILCQGNGILNVGDETRIYHGRWRNVGWDPANADLMHDYHAEVALATIPRDRWAGLGLYKRATGIDTNNGGAWTCPITLPEGDWSLALNADGVAGLSVEIADERFNLLPEFSGENSATAQAGDGLDVPVKWPKGNLAELNGKTVRFRFRFQRSDGVEPMLYAANLTA